jgi:tRNA 2-thiouridine synthesizing protein E
LSQDGAAQSPALPGTLLGADGFLREASAWDTAIAEALASEEGIDLSPAHWEIIHLLRRYYQTYDSAPAMRALVRYCGRELGADKGRSLYLLQLFPGSPARVASRIAGLPKPLGCL